MRKLHLYVCLFGPLLFLLPPATSSAWNDETHIAIAKAAGYYKWFNAAAADIAKLKIGKREEHNHYVNNIPGTSVTPKMVVDQIEQYNRKDEKGHLYGAIIAAFRNYINDKKEGKYGENHMAFCAHYVGDLSMPLHNIPYGPYNKKYHQIMDGIINDEVMDNLDKIRIYPIIIHSEKELINEIVRIANLSATLGFMLESENRLITKAEAYQQISHSASLFKAIIDYGNRLTKNSILE